MRRGRGEEVRRAASVHQNKNTHSEIKKCPHGRYIIVSRCLPLDRECSGAVATGRVSDRVVGGMVVGCDRLRASPDLRATPLRVCPRRANDRIVVKHLRPLHHHASICCLLVWVVMEGRKENKQKKWFDENQSLGSSVLVALLGIRRAAFVCTPWWLRNKEHY